MIYRLGPNRRYHGYPTYAEAARQQRGPIYLDPGDRRQIAELPPEPFTLVHRHGDVVTFRYALNGLLHQGSGRGRGHGTRRRGAVIPDDAPWVHANTELRQAGVVNPRRAAA